MKRILLSALLIFFIGGAFAQNLALYFDGNSIAHGSTVMVIGDPTAEYIQARVNVKNIGTAAIPTKVKKIINAGDTLPGTSNYFCWGLCFTPTTYVSPNNISIEPGQTIEEFYGDYNPNTVIGISKITYVFFNQDNANDSVAVTIQYNASPASVDDPASANMKFSEVYPNPAVSTASVEYALSSDVSKASIIITNMLGCRVKEVALNELSGKVQISVSDLVNGIYFYSLVADDKVYETRKFVVKR